MSSPFKRTPAASKASIDITERFKNLSVGKPSDGVDAQANVADSVTPGHGSVPASPTLEELIAELEADDTGYKLEPEELTEAESLLAEAKRSLPTREHDTMKQSPDRLGDKPLSPSQPVSEQGSGKVESVAELDDEVEADVYLHEILDEAAIEKGRDVEASVEHSPPQSSQKSSRRTSSDNKQAMPHACTDGQSPPLFPSVPTDLKPTSPSEGLLFPSAPSAAPRTQNKDQAIKKTEYADDEIDSWCIICLANATVRCTGCAGDLYCNVSRLLFSMSD